MRVFYFISDSGDVLQRRKTYKKARHKKYLSRWHTYFREERDRKCKKTL